MEAKTAQGPGDKAAWLTLKLKADSGYSVESNSRISSNQWTAIRAIEAGHPTQKEAKIKKINAELLEALKAIVRSAELNQAAVNTDLLVNARSAIAKATGGEQ